MKPASNTSHEWSEDKLQAEFYIWFHNSFPQLRGLLFAVPNGGARDGLQGKVLKATGTFSGVSDMFFLYKGKCHPIEFKRPDGRGVASENQLKWASVVIAHGFDYQIFNDLEEAKQHILNIIVGSDAIEVALGPWKQIDMFDERS